MSESLDKIELLLARRGAFVCSPCSSASGTARIEIGNHAGPPASEARLADIERRTGKELTRSHKEVLRRWNGLELFFQELPAGRGLAGFLLYSTEKMLFWNKTVLDGIAAGLRDSLAYADDEYRQELRDDIHTWIPGLLVVGDELGSGNCVAVDYTKPSGEGEYSILFLDHETVGGGSYGQKVLAGSFFELADLIAADPARFLTESLGACTSYSDLRTDEQWFPEEYELI